ncbi:putative ATP-dependent helicase C17A2.12-like [Panicum miliaceum]|uniref:ATP-dependent helicase C17A2.12-like n=1 Tax=Panicum miliaceum TaxID=4540 RepID=A0A3L6Q8H9_PANMI|nr:putative ATP-dependent helicase C17A2.12-like [Panicum miliaceum]
MDIIDLSSDSEEGIIDLSSDSEDNNEFHSCREDDTDYDDPVSPYHLPLVPLNTAPDQNSVEQPTSLEYDVDLHQIAKKEYDNWFSSRNASSSYSPVDNRSTTEMSSGVSNDISRDLPLSITYGSAAKSEQFYVPSVEHQLPQSFTNGSFSPQSFAPNHSSLDGNRIKEEPAMKFSGFQRFTASGNGMSSFTMPRDDVFIYGGPRSHRIFPPPMPSMTSVNDATVDNDHISQEKGEEDLLEGVMSVSLLKHQKMALAWMLSKENSSHCLGGILADDQGLGKTISTIALIQKERVKQSRFMTSGSYCTTSVLSIDDDDVVIVMDKKELKAEPLNKLHDSRQLHVANSLKLPDSQSGAVTDCVEPRKKTRVKPSASTLGPKIRPAAGTLVVCPASVLRQWANELSVKVMEGAKLSVLVYHGGSRTRDPNELAKYDVVITTYMTVANEVPKENSDDDKEGSEISGICPELCVGGKRKRTKKKQSKAKKKNKPSNSDGGPLARVRWFRVVLDEAQTIKKLLD